ncbi:hypothetical protein [Sphingobacterium wenxiniae]|uniref:Uncharacterized protein n=1 Tax=Sphingobacterium wenxiniae TaxID=683125 RepID=A0A1I6R9H4_9SPHI|nr:hypothetical protein [Sphingobacterium wenxiniae]SFS61158.1 hypothetical protein SAMN05660206_103213 [Sphingobacterium wenxiniae]
MAIQKDGPNGPVIGKFGVHYGYMLNGQNIIRGPRRPNSKKPSPAMLLNREKMKVANAFTRMLIPIFRYGYKNLAPKGSRVGAVQQAQAQVFKECIEINEEGRPYVNPEKILVFRGDLPPLHTCSVERRGDLLHFQWTPPSGLLGASYKINILLHEETYNADLKIGVAEVNAGKCEVPMIGMTKGPLHVYVGIIEGYTGQMSDSVYLGIVE